MLGWIECCVRIVWPQRKWRRYQSAATVRLRFVRTLTSSEASTQAAMAPPTRAPRRRLNVAIGKRPGRASKSSASFARNLPGSPGDGPARHTTLEPQRRRWTATGTRHRLHSNMFRERARHRHHDGDSINNGPSSLATRTRTLRILEADGPTARLAVAGNASKFPLEVAAEVLRESSHYPSEWVVASECRVASSARTRPLVEVAKTGDWFAVDRDAYR